MGDHGEVGEVALYAGVQDGLGPGVAQRGPVLVQQVHQLLANVSEIKINNIETYPQLFGFLKVSKQASQTF